jgi:hypothetical protein
MHLSGRYRLPSPKLRLGQSKAQAFEPQHAGPYRPLSDVPEVPFC